MTDQAPAEWPKWTPPGPGDASSNLGVTQLSSEGRPVITVRPQPKGQEWPKWEPPNEAPPIGKKEALWEGLKQGWTWSLEPRLEGAAEAGKQVAHDAGMSDEDLQYMPTPMAAAFGVAGALHDWMTGHSDPEVQAAHERGRAAAQKLVTESQEAYPWHFYGGMMAGAMMMPGLGIARAGAPLARMGFGALEGAIQGGVQGAGEAYSEGAPVSEILSRGAKGAGLGAVTGGALHGTVGAPASGSSGQRAAATAESLGTPLPRGTASDNPVIQHTTAISQVLPFSGQRISKKLEKTTAAAGRHLENVSGQMTGGTANRFDTDTIMRPALERVIEGNKATTDNAYDALRAMLPRGQGDRGGDAEIHSMPRLKAALDKLVKQRRLAKVKDPEAGFERFRKLQDDASFNGAQQVRSESRESMASPKDNPGFKGGEWTLIEKAMTDDMNQMVAQGAHAIGNNPTRAVQAFRDADVTAARLAEQNKRLRTILSTPGEGVTSALTGAAKEKSGDIRLLQQLKRSMSPQDYSHIGGTLLRELGTGANNEFSAKNFINNWGKMSDPAKRLLFPPGHLRDIEEIVHMGQHMGRALKDTNVSHTGDVYTGVEFVRAIGEATLAAGGGLGIATVGASAGYAAIPSTIAWVLGNSARTASTRAWVKAYQAYAGDRSPARAALFKVATRNLGNTLGVPADKLTKIAEEFVPGSTQNAENNK